MADSGSISGGFGVLADWWIQALELVGGEFAAQNAGLVTIILVVVFGITMALCYMAFEKIEALNDDKVKKPLSVLIAFGVTTFMLYGGYIQMLIPFVWIMGLAFFLILAYFGYGLLKTGYASAKGISANAHEKLVTAKDVWKTAAQRDETVKQEIQEINRQKKTMGFVDKIIRGTNTVVANLFGVLKRARQYLEAAGKEVQNPTPRTRPYLTDALVLLRDYAQKSETYLKQSGAVLETIIEQHEKKEAIDRSLTKKITSFEKNMTSINTKLKGFEQQFTNAKLPKSNITTSWNAGLKADINAITELIKTNDAASKNLKKEVNIVTKKATALKNKAKKLGKEEDRMVKGFEIAIHETAEAGQHMDGNDNKAASQSIKVALNAIDLLLKELKGIQTEGVAMLNDSKSILIDETKIQNDLIIIEKTIKMFEARVTKVEAELKVLGQPQGKLKGYPGTKPGVTP